MLSLCFWTSAQGTSGVDSPSSRSSSQLPPSPSLPHSDSSSQGLCVCEQRNNSPPVLQWNMKPSLVPQRLWLWPAGTFSKREKMRPSASMKMFQRFLPSRESLRYCYSLQRQTRELRANKNQISHVLGMLAVSLIESTVYNARKHGNCAGFLT